jgi:crossover junction endodeoxyribonuclease RusA
MTTQTLFVVGDPAAQGSKRMVRLKNGRTVLLEQSRKVKPWREEIGRVARAQKCKMIEGDVIVDIVVRFVRPTSHTLKSGKLSSAATTRPGRVDADKCARAVLDALTGICYADDRQVCALSIQRVWANPECPGGAIITVAPCPESGNFAYYGG